MRKSLLVLFCFINISGFSQMLNKQYVWNDLEVAIPTCFTKCAGEFRSTFSYYLGKDSILNSKTYYVLNDTVYDSKPYGGPVIYTSSAGLIREDVETKKVYLIENGYEDEILLYDFSLNKGDEFNITNSNIYNGTYTVTNIDTASYYGIDRRVITLEKDQYTKLEWIVGIGAKQGFLYSHSYNGASDLLCLHKDKELLYKNTLGLDCIVSTRMAIPTINQSDLKIFPIPVIDYINIEQNTIIKSIELLDVCGLSLVRFYPNQNNFRFSLTGLNKGIYFIKVDFELRKIVIE